MLLFEITHLGSRYFIHTVCIFFFTVSWMRGSVRVTWYACLRGSTQSSQGKKKINSDQIETKIYNTFFQKQNSRRRPVKGVLHISGDGLRVVEEDTKV